MPLTAYPPPWAATSGPSTAATYVAFSPPSCFFFVATPHEALVSPSTTDGKCCDSPKGREPTKKTCTFSRTHTHTHPPLRYCRVPHPVSRLSGWRVTRGLRDPVPPTTVPFPPLETSHSTSIACPSYQTTASSDVDPQCPSRSRSTTSLSASICNYPVENGRSYHRYREGCQFPSQIFF